MAVKASVTITISRYRDTDNITRFYKLQASTASAPAKPTTLTPSGWTDTEPTYTSGSTNTLYFTDRYIFSDGTFQYTEVSKSTSYEAAKEAYNKAQAAQDTADTTQNNLNNLKIGGRNLLMYTDYSKSTTSADGIQNRGSYATLSIISDDIPIGSKNKTLKIITTDSAISGQKDIWQKCWNNQVLNKNIVLSLYVKGSEESKAFFRLAGSSSSKSSAVMQYDITTDWTKLEIDLGKVTNSGATNNTEIIYGFNTAGIFYINSMKLEYGDKSTDWTPAPEDIDEELANKPSNQDLADAKLNFESNISDVRAEIIGLRNLLLSLVVDEDNQSMYSQDDDSFTFTFGNILSKFSDNEDNMNKLLQVIDSMTNYHLDENGKYVSDYSISDLNSTLSEESIKLSYVRINGHDTDAPEIVLGSLTSDFKVRITNTSIDFLYKTNVLAFANNETFSSNSMRVQQNLTILRQKTTDNEDDHGFIWSTRRNNNLTLKIF